MEWIDRALPWVRVNEEPIAALGDLRGVPRWQYAVGSIAVSLTLFLAY
jgi:hypothetical protein